MEHYDPMRNKLFTVETGYYNLNTGKITHTIGELKKIDGLNIIGDDNFISYFMNCEFNNSMAENITITTDVQDVEEVDIELADFNLAGLIAKGKITHVIDGDTVRMMVYVPIDKISKYVHDGHGNKKIHILAKNSGGGFYTSFTCRLYGIDAMEKNTLQGIRAKELMIEEYAKTNNIVYSLFLNADKYGRQLVILYSDSKMSNKLNNLLVDYEDPKLGKLVLSYDGGKKSEYSSGLEKI